MTTGARTRIVLVRHAAIDTAGRLCGSLDLPLSTVGRTQLEVMLRGPLTTPAPDALLTSPLRRAREVAVALGHRWSTPPQSVDWAREIDCGRLEGVPLELIRRDHPEVWARNEAEADDTFAWPGGETYAAFRARVAAGLDRAAMACAGGTVVVVTHAGVISQVLGMLKHRPPCVWRPDRPRPLTATEIVWQDGAPRALVSFSDADWWR